MKKSQMCLIENVNFVDLYNIVRYIYAGELTIDRNYLTHFIRIGDLFGVKDIHELEIDIINPNVSVVPQTEAKQEDEEIAELVEMIPETVEVQNAVEIEVAGPSKVPNILRSKSKAPRKMSKLRVFPLKKAPVIDEEEFLKHVDLVPCKGPSPQKSQSPTKKPAKRLVIKLPRSNRRRNTIETQKMECRHCSRPYNASSSLRTHEKYCFLNPNRSISVCNICKEEVKPGSMVFHKKRYHDLLPTPRRRMTIDAEILTAAK
jgi:hypothetical protein